MDIVYLVIVHFHCVLIVDIASCSNERFLRVNTILLLKTWSERVWRVWCFGILISPSILRCLTRKKILWSSESFLSTFGQNWLLQLFAFSHCRLGIFMSIKDVSVTFFLTARYTDTRIIRTLWHVPLVFASTRFHLASHADILRRASGTRDARLRMSAGEARFHWTFIYVSPSVRYATTFDVRHDWG